VAFARGSEVFSAVGFPAFFVVRPSGVARRAGLALRLVAAVASALVLGGETLLARLGPGAGLGLDLAPACADFRGSARVVRDGSDVAALAFDAFDAAVQHLALLR